MGPTNQALVKLFLADKALRDAQARLDAVTKNVRLQERKVTDLTAREAVSKTELTKLQARAGELDLEIKSRDVKIESLRAQQAQAQTNREYQAHLVQINTQKVDKTQIEEEALALLERIEKLAADAVGLLVQRDQESAKFGTMRSEIDGRVVDLNTEIDALRPAREEAAAAVPPKALVIFDRLGERYEGESMEGIDKPHPKREEYIATVCNIDLTVDVYNRLHTRDELVFCSSCGRILYIPEDLTPQKAVHKPKEKKAPRIKKSDLAAPVALQTLASSVVSSVDQDVQEHERDPIEASEDAATSEASADDAQSTSTEPATTPNS